MKGGKLLIEGDCLMPCGDMFAGEATVYGHVIDFLPTFRQKGMITENGHDLTVFHGDVANRNAKGTLRVGSFDRI